MTFSPGSVRNLSYDNIENKCWLSAALLFIPSIPLSYLQACQTSDSSLLIILILSQAWRFSGD